MESNDNKNKGRSDDYDECYHRRSNPESTFSAKIKKFGSLSNMGTTQKKRMKKCLDRYATTFPH